MSTPPTPQDQLKEVLNVMLLHITRLNVDAIGYDDDRKERCLVDSRNATDLATWFKETYVYPKNADELLVDDYHTRVLALIEKSKTYTEVGSSNEEFLEHHKRGALLAKIKDNCRKIEQQLLYM